MLTFIEKEQFNCMKKTFFRSVFFKLFFGSLLIGAAAFLYITIASANLKKQNEIISTELNKVEDLVARVNGDSTKLHEIKNQIFTEMLSNPLDKDIKQVSN